MLLCKKEKCSGIGKMNNQTFANICFNRCLKKSYVRFPRFFRSTTVGKPQCTNINGVSYLTTTGEGSACIGCEEVRGIYTLILADSGSNRDGFAFSFISVNPSGPSTLILMGAVSGVCVKIKDSSCSKRISAVQSSTTETPITQMPVSMSTQVPDLNNMLFSDANNFIAKKITIYADGRTKEDDLSNWLQSQMPIS